MAGLVVYVVGGALYLMQLGVFTWSTYGLYGDKLVGFFLVMLPQVSLFWVAVSAVWHAPRAPLQRLRNSLSPRGLAHYCVGLMLLMCVIPFLGTFTQIKGSLSRHGFGYDPMLADVEAWLHGGILPSNWLAEMFGSGWFLQLMQLNYNISWQVYNLLFMSLLVLHPAMFSIRRYYLAFYFSMWVLLGNVLAGIFISAGPAFYALVEGDTARFAMVQDMLQGGAQYQHSAYRFQQYLWKHWEAGASSLGTGISAFPSLHIFLVTCNALFAYRYVHRWLGVVAIAYALIMMMSSAYLGWHYLIDGYASALVTIALFAVFTYFLPRRRQRSRNATSSSHQGS